MSRISGTDGSAVEPLAFPRRSGVRIPLRVPEGTRTATGPSAFTPLLCSRIGQRPHGINNEVSLTAPANPDSDPKNVRQFSASSSPVSGSCLIGCTSKHGSTVVRQNQRLTRPLHFAEILQRLRLSPQACPKTLGRITRTAWRGRTSSRGWFLPIYREWEERPLRGRRVPSRIFRWVAG
jgi:hypothetical protein